jgi:hypothetical protein
VAELQAGCETLRLKMKTEQPTPALINSITRLESTAARAERALFKIAPPKTDTDRRHSSARTGMSDED